jgi:hypothetical protein
VIAQGRLALLDHPTQTRELTLLERRPPRGQAEHRSSARRARRFRELVGARLLWALQQAALPAVSTEMSDDELWALRRLGFRPAEEMVRESEF